MANFISEDDIEIAVLGKLSKSEFGYDILKCDPDPNKRENLNDGTERSSVKGGRGTRISTPATTGFKPNSDC